MKSICTSRFSKWYICNISRSAKGIKLKLPGSSETDLEINQNELCISSLSKDCIYKILGRAKGINLKFLWNFELNQSINQCFYCPKNTKGFNME